MSIPKDRATDQLLDALCADWDFCADVREADLVQGAKTPDIQTLHRFCSGRRSRITRPSRQLGAPYQAPFRAALWAHYNAARFRSLSPSIQHSGFYILGHECSDR